MFPNDWKTIVLSDPEHEHLVAEIYYLGQFIALMDREEGKDAIRVTLQDLAGKKVPIPVEELLAAIQDAITNLQR